MIMRLGGRPVRGGGRDALVQMLRDDADGQAPGAVDGPGDRASVGRRQTMRVSGLAHPTRGSGSQ